MGPECSDVDVKLFFFEKKEMRQEKACKKIEVFSVREKGEHPVASKWRWDDC